MPDIPDVVAGAQGSTAQPPAPPVRFGVETETRGDKALIRISGELDAVSGHLVADALEMLAHDGANHLRIEVFGVTFVDSTGVRMISDLLEAHPAIVVTLAGASPIYQKLLTLTGIAAHIALLE